MGRGHRHGRLNSLLCLLSPEHYHTNSNLGRDIALGVLIAKIY